MAQVLRMCCWYDVNFTKNPALKITMVACKKHYHNKTVID